jgi:cytochrome c oxidase subunit 2
MWISFAVTARTPVLLQATTADVIHSFWVPELNRKIDTIPGKVNEILLYADEPGQYRGQCAEYCGLQHTHMSMVVDAQPPAQFRAWLANESRPARSPSGGLARRGLRVFLDGQTLGALTVPNRPADLAAWITDSQHAKPGNQMPDVRLGASQLRALVAYLDSLK